MTQHLRLSRPRREVRRTSENTSSPDVGWISLRRMRRYALDVIMASDTERQGGDDELRDTPDGGGDQGDAGAQAPPHLRLRSGDLPQPPEDPRRLAARSLRRGRSSLRLRPVLPRRPRRPDSHAPDTLRPALPPLHGRSTGGPDALPGRDRRRGGRGYRPGGGRAPAAVRAPGHIPHLAPGARRGGVRAAGEPRAAGG